MKVTLTDNGILAHYKAHLEAMSKNGPKELAATLNQVGAEIRRETVRAEAQQTGLSTRVIGRAQRETKATVNRLEYRIEARGGDVRLKYFHPVESRFGVTARPWGVPKTFVGTFMKGGLWGRRVELNMGGHVFRRVGSGRLPIEGGRSGIYIPAEMVQGKSREAFAQGAAKTAGVALRRLSKLAP